MDDKFRLSNEVRRAIESVVDDRVRTTQAAALRAYKATVVVAPSAATGKCEVRLAHDSTVLSLPYAPAVNSAQEGDVVWVLVVYGNWRNAVVWQNGDWTNTPTGDVTSVNGRTGAVTLTAGDVGAPTVAEMTSALALKYDASNPNGYITNTANAFSYSNLSGKPTIPPAQVNSDWNATSGKAQILNKPTIPTQTSQLTNNSGYIANTANAFSYANLSGKPAPYVLPQATATALGGIMASPKTASETAEVKIDTATGRLYTTGGEGVTGSLEWHPVTLPSVAYWRSVTYGGGKFVAVAEANSNKAAYSADGVTWTATTLPSSAHWQSVTYGGGKFVAVARNSNKAAYSTDGVTWTAATLPSSVLWQSVTYGGGKFVAVANASNAAYSSDGITWHAATLPSPANWRSVTYGGGKFVAVAYGSDETAYSTDGITWTAATLPSSASWQSVTSSGGRFVAVASGPTDRAAFSTDGITWTAATLPSVAGWFGLAYGEGKFVTTAYGGDETAYSTDGIAWTATTLPSSADWVSVTYGNGKFVAVAADSNKAAYSTFEVMVILTSPNSTRYRIKVSDSGTLSTEAV